MKRKIRLTESDLHNIIKESVKKVLSEGKVTNNIPFKRREYDEEYLQKLKDIAEVVDPETKEKILNMVRSYELQNPKGGELHSKRAYKYSNGKPRFGRDWDTQQYIDNKKWREASSIINEEKEVDKILSFDNNFSFQERLLKIIEQKRLTAPKVYDEIGISTNV